MKATSSLLTATRLSCLRRCCRQHYYRYELGLSRIRRAAPLRFGSAFHVGLALHRGLFRDADAAVIDTATGGYEVCPDWADPTDWAVEREQLRQLLAGHFWRYRDDNLGFLTVEGIFELPLINPTTGGSSRTFRLAGKMDGIVRLADGRLAVLEYKTAGEDISPDSAYWLRLRRDGQISMYVLAARALGHDVATVLYDVTRKPTIRLRKGETPEQYGERLLKDIGDRPDYYFQRREIPCLEDQLEQFRCELWQQAKLLLACRRHGWWFRNVSALTCRNCQFSHFCLDGVTVVPDGPPPSGFEFLPDVHPELAVQEGE